jgi:rubrerythrin
VTLARRVQAWADQVANAARQTREQVAARLDRAQPTDADAPSPDVRATQWLCRACGTTYDSRRDGCRICGSRMVERIPEETTGAETGLVESPGTRPRR